MLIDILQDLEPLEAQGPSPAGIAVESIVIDSREVKPGAVFVAMKGTRTDGHAYLQSACESGAVAVVAEQVPEGFQRPDNVCLILVQNSNLALGWMASAYYNNPSTALKVLGVTGTNGKTSVTTLLHQAFTHMGYRCGLIGTVGNQIGNELIPATHTTPDAIRVQHLLSEMLEAGCSHVFMEVSSHAIHQQRIAGVQFDGAVFTNLTHDHLDYHETFAAYRDAKKQLFDDLNQQAFALVNVDDKNGRFMLQNTRAKTQTFGLKTSADFKGKILENSIAGLHLHFNEFEVHTPLIGSFNAYNLLACFGAAVLLGEQADQVLAALSLATGAEGRFEIVRSGNGDGKFGVVDYAHTPDALEKVLDTLQQLRYPGTRIFTVVGCGGDRDRAKRPVMAKIGAKKSDQLILTSDNPRTESPTQILADMEAGLDSELERKSITIENREQAIKTAVRLAGQGDVILVAGKGHEKYQDINGVKHPFDDKALLMQYMNE
ncbi:MAG: UDP-N-acetylmuramoyl-L-alanyl-D-glutamate--2,6-diaminopimelate ligase [Saprospiraceae bacterium]